MLWDYVCARDHVSEEWVTNAEKDSPRNCPVCGEAMRRCPGGKGMLYFEEGRGRVHVGLSDKPITSYAQRDRLMRSIGAVEGGSQVPKSVAKNPQSKGMKEYMSKDPKGRWI